MFPGPLVRHHHKLHLIAHLLIERWRTWNVWKFCFTNLQNLATLDLAHVEEKLLALILLIGEETELTLDSLNMGAQLLLV